MVVFYFDTSAIVKRYHKELGSEVVDRLFEAEGHGLAISFWTVLEFTVVLSARRRRKQISDEVFNATIARFLKDVLDRFTIRAVDDEAVASAIQVAMKYGLPSADCLQLATSIELRKALAESGQKLALVSSDRDMCNAARREGLEFIDPEEKEALQRLEEILA